MLGLLRHLPCPISVLEQIIGCLREGISTGSGRGVVNDDLLDHDGGPDFNGAATNQFHGARVNLGADRKLEDAARAAFEGHFRCCGGQQPEKDDDVINVSNTSTGNMNQRGLADGVAFGIPEAIPQQTRSIRHQRRRIHRWLPAAHNLR